MEENEERTLYENLEYLNETKGIIKQAIIDKGVEIDENTSFREYADKISDITTGGSGDIKLFETQEDMQADVNPQENDLAVVYGNRFNHWTGTSTRSIGIAKNVILPEQVTEDMPVCNLDSRGYSSITLTPTSCVIKYNTFMSTSISYSSTDGIHYTTTSTASTISNRVNMVKPTDGTWSDLFGYFMGTSTIEFDGLYKYTNHQDEEYCYFPMISNISYTYDSSSSSLTNLYTYYTKYNKTIKKADLIAISKKIIAEQSVSTYFVMQDAFYAEDGELYICYTKSNITYLMYDTNKNLIGVGNNNAESSSIPSDYFCREFKINTDDMTYTEVFPERLGVYSRGGGYFCIVCNIKPITYMVSAETGNPRNQVYVAVSTKTSGANGYYKNSFPTIGYIDSYIYAPTSLSNTLPENITIGNKLYTANGVVTGTMANNGKLIYNSMFSEQVIPQGYTSSGVIHPVNMPHIANHSQVGGNKASSVTRKYFSIEKFYYICSCYCKRRCYNANWLGIFR